MMKNLLLQATSRLVKQLIALTLLFTCFANNTLPAQGTVLNPGDVIISQIQMDFPDDFRMIPLVDLAAGTTIFVTDAGTYNNGSFANPNPEAMVKYVAPNLIPAGEVIQYDVMPAQFTHVTDACNTNPSDDFSLHTAGDQLLVFQDADGDGVDAFCNPNFIFAINAASTAWNGDPTDHNQTSLPAGLTDGVNAIAVGAGTGDQDEWDNAIFAGNYPYASVADYLAEFYDPNNWAQSNFITDPAYWIHWQNHPQNIFGLNGLPVELVHFKATNIDDKVSLDWQTASELNNEGFQVERSKDGLNWEGIGFVKGRGNSSMINNYSFMDLSPVKGNNYYRLKQLDFDGSFEYSTIKTVLIEKEGISFHVFPNPVRDRKFNITFDEIPKHTVTLTLFNMNGQVLKVLQVENLNTEMDLGGYASGMYLLEVNNGIEVRQERIIKR